jgi:hypothetical protein
MDAGIATDENLQILADNEFDYICVSRSKLKNYKIVEGSKPVEVEDKKHQKISLQKVESDRRFIIREDRNKIGGKSF